MTDHKTHDLDNMTNDQIEALAAKYDAKAKALNEHASEIVRFSLLSTSQKATTQRNLTEADKMRAEAKAMSDHADALESEGKS